MMYRRVPARLIYLHEHTTVQTLPNMLKSEPGLQAYPAGAEIDSSEIIIYNLSVHRVIPIHRDCGYLPYPNWAAARTNDPSLSKDSGGKDVPTASRPNRSVSI